MSKKRIKQYLMLLTVIGLVSIASGSGTFASFNAEVTNNGNTFATGSLYLHDTVVDVNNTACMSESTPSNSNVPATVGGANPGDACSVPFTVPNSQFAPNGLLNGSAPAGATASITVEGWQGSGGLEFAIPAGHEVQISQGGLTDICTTGASSTSAGATTITFNGSCTLANSYATGAVISSYGPFIAHLELKNAGTIDGSGLKFQLNGTGCDITTPGLNGTTTLCDNLDFAVTETNSSWTASVDQATGNTTGALGCAYPVAAGGCTLASSTNLGNLATRTGATWDTLGLSSIAADRQPTGVDASTTRYLLVEIWPGDLQNQDMGSAATFDLVWHMDQA